MSEVSETTEKMLSKKSKKKVEAPPVLSEGKLATIVHEIQELDYEHAKSDLKTLLENEGLNDFRLGGILVRYQISNEWWEGCSTFREFVETKLNLTYRKVMYLIGIYKCLVENDIEWSKVQMIGWTRLKELVPVLTKENQDEWIAKAKVLTTLQLIDAVRDALKKGKTEGSDGTEGETTTSTVTTLTFKVHADQKETVRTALDKAKEELDTEYDTVALEGICTAFLGGQFEVKGATSLFDQMKGMELSEVLEVLEKCFPDAEITVAV